MYHATEVPLDDPSFLPFSSEPGNLHIGRDATMSIDSRFTYLALHAEQPISYPDRSQGLVPNYHGIG